MNPLITTLAIAPTGSPRNVQSSESFPVGWGASSATSHSHDLRRLKPSTIDPRTRCDTAGKKPDYINAALEWFKFGFDVMPIVPGTKRPAVKWDPWLQKLSLDTIAHHWSTHPDHELGFIVGDDYIVFDADSPESVQFLEDSEAKFNLRPRLVVTTKRGEHHYYRLDESVTAGTASFSTETHPARVDVKTGRSMVILPPSTGKAIAASEDDIRIDHARNLSIATQAFVDQLAGRDDPPLSPTPPIAASASRAPNECSIPLLQAILERIDPDCDYDKWLVIGAVIFNETHASDAGLELYNIWSSKGDKYKGRNEVLQKWRSFSLEHPRPAKLATLRYYLEVGGIDWTEICSAVEYSNTPILGVAGGRK